LGSPEQELRLRAAGVPRFKRRKFRANQFIMDEAVEVSHAEAVREDEEMDYQE